jgi:hypothetical protein
MEDNVDNEEEQEELLIASVAAFFVATSAPISPMLDNETGSTAFNTKRITS